jgi:branched-chain amino acid transport system permease protein
MRGKLNSGKTGWAVGFIVLAFFVIYPFLVNTERSYLVYFLYMTFIYVAMAQGWNLAGGYTGQVSLGQHAFFGVGCYVTAILWRAKAIGYLDPLGMVLSGICAVILAILVGLLLLSKLRGDYFALGTLGLGEILHVIAINGGRVTQGPMGINLPSDAYISMTYYYFIALAIAVLTLIVVLVMTRSSIGLALVAIRENEVAAAANGVAVLKYKVIAFAAGAFVTGLCGSLNAYYTFHIDSAGAFDLDWVMVPILMTILGGSGTFLGPILGAFILSGVYELANMVMPQLHPIFSAAFIVLVTLFLPDGLMKYITGHKEGVLRRLPLFRAIARET